MAKYLFKNATFVKSAVVPKDYPQLKDSRGKPFPEIAIVGRSNVGKSSLINHLLQHKGLAKTSSTPGKTQMLNFFNLNNQICFVDLPGYGYAEVAKEEKKNWGQMIESYLNDRASLQLVLFLLDIRHLPTTEDYQMYHWILAQRPNTVIILTKADKIAPRDRERQKNAILKALENEEIPSVIYSIQSAEGRKHLIYLIESCLY